MRPTKGENQGIKRFLSGRRNARAGRFRRRKGQAITRRGGRARKGARERDNHGRRASPPSGVLPERPAFPRRVAPALFLSGKKRRRASGRSRRACSRYASGSAFPRPPVPAGGVLRVPASLPRRGVAFHALAAASGVAVSPCAASRCPSRAAVALSFAPSRENAIAFPSPAGGTIPK